MLACGDLVRQRSFKLAASEPPLNHARPQYLGGNVGTHGKVRIAKQGIADSLTGTLVVCASGKLHIAAPRVFHAVSGHGVAQCAGNVRALAFGVIHALEIGRTALLKDRLHGGGGFVPSGR